MPKKGYIQSEEHILKRLTNKVPVNRILTCCACGNKFPREQIVTNNGFCDECITHTKLCECGCETVMFAYTKKGGVRQYLNQSHANKAINASIRSNMEDEEYANRISEIRSEAALKKYQDDPELKDVRRQQMLERYEDPEEHKKTSEKSKEYWSDEDNREAQCQRQLEFIEKNPEITEFRTQYSREYWNDEDARSKQKMNAKRLWDNYEYREFQRLKHIGNKNGRGNRGKPKSEEHKRKMGESRKNYYIAHPEEIQYKERNPNWNGGTSFLPYDDNFNYEFKNMIRRRQNYECADKHLGNCNHDERELCVHHINRVKTDTTIENCIALCFYHHSISHNEKARIRHREFIRILIENDKTS